MTVAWVFPGQGAQRAGMGGDAFERYPELVREADDILGYSVRAQCLDGAAPGLRDTRYVQPALFVVNALDFLAMAAEGPAPDVLAGHSLGEYNALFAAGCFDFATGVRLVRRRGELMSRGGEGGMAAVIGMDVAALDALLNRAGLADLDLANRNSAEQVTLSGPLESLRRAGDAVRAEGGRFVPLRVSAPFHSRYMAGAAAEFASSLRDIPFADPGIPVIANVTGRPYPAGAVADLLARQIDGPVRWWESMTELIDRGVTNLVEVGPGRVLTDLWVAARSQPWRPEPPVADAALDVEVATGIRAESLGSEEFRRDYRLRYAYLAGAMFHGIASTALVVRLARAGLLGFFGSGGLSLDDVRAALRTIRTELGSEHRFGMNLLASPDDPTAERETIALYLQHDVRFVEAASFTGVTPSVLHFRFHGANRAVDGGPRTVRHLVAKVSRPEVATAFMSPPPPAMLAGLVAEGALTADEAAIARELPVAADIGVEADSGGHTDAGNPYVLLPAMLRLRDELMVRHGYARRIRIGAAGGIGSPEAAAAAFAMGADFVISGSINQCSPEAGTSDAVKDLLAQLDVQDTGYAPAGDLFELGARVQVVRKATLFPARANKLYQVYRQFDSLDDIDAVTRAMIEERYFRKSFEQVWAETKEHLLKDRWHDIERAERKPKIKMALVFRWYFGYSTRAALYGTPAEKVNYQIHCGPAMGAFNRCVAGTHLEPWHERHVDAIAEMLMTGAAAHLDRAVRGWSDPQPGG